ANAADAAGLADIAGSRPLSAACWNAAMLPPNLEKAEALAAIAANAGWWLLSAEKAAELLTSAENSLGSAPSELNADEFAAIALSAAACDALACDADSAAAFWTIEANAAGSLAIAWNAPGLAAMADIAAWFEASAAKP